MKIAFRVIAVSAVLSMPAALFAQQSNESLTRDQVKADLQQLQQAGYQPAAADDSNYPNDIQAAEARIEGQATGVGGAQGGASQSGRQMQPQVQPGAPAWQPEVQ